MELFYFSLITEGNLVVRGLTTATQISDYGVFSADRTIDGYPNRLWMTGGSCSHTGSGQTEAWLKIILDKVYNVKQVRFWYRNDRKYANSTCEERKSTYALHFINDI